MGFKMSVLASLYSLSKNNNGFFKSEKQAAFLVAELERRQGLFVESFSFGEHNGAQATRSVYVSWDTQGVIEIKTVADKSGKTAIKFTRLNAVDYAAKQQAKDSELAQAQADKIRIIENLIASHQAKIAAIKAEHCAVIAMLTESSKAQGIELDGLQSLIDLQEKSLQNNCRYELQQLPLLQAELAELIA